MMTRLLSITLLLFILLFAGCNKSSVNTEEAAPITFSGAFELIETRGRTLSGEEMPDINAQVVGSLRANDFTKIYFHEENFTLGAGLDQQVTFIKGEGILGNIVHYPTTGMPVYVRAFAPSNIALRDASLTPNSVVFTDLTGHEDVMLTRLNTIGQGASSGGGEGDKDDRDLTLVFEHKLSKMSFKIKAETPAAAAEWGYITDVTLLNFPNNITLDLRNENYSVNESDYADIALIESVFLPAVDPKLLSFSPMVPPSPVGALTDSWSLSITSAQNGTVVLVADEVLKSGEHRVFVITLQDNIEASFNMEIAPWIPAEDGGNTGNSEDI